MSKDIQCVLCNTSGTPRRLKEGDPAIKASVCKVCMTRIEFKVLRHNARSVTSYFMANEWLALLEKSNGICMYCEEAVGISQLTIEHMKPICKGGDNHIDNIVAVCRTCNASKGKKGFYEWIVSPSGRVRTK